MAGGKESPRQKMIGMMYLVLTALLALNVSAEVLEAFNNITNGIDETIKVTSTKNTDLAGSIADRVKNAGDDDNAKLVGVKAAEASKIADGLYSYLQTLKEQVVEDDTDQAYDDGSEECYVNLGKLKDPKNIDVATRLLVEKKAGEQQSGGAKLKAEINKTRESLVNLFDGLVGTTDVEKDAIEAALTLNANDNPDEKGPKKVWEYKTFNSIPRGAAIALLTKFQNDAKNAEAEILKRLLDKISAGKLEVEGLEPVVKQNKAILARGEKLTAEIFLSAKIGGITPEIKDTRSGKAIKVEGTTGKYEATADKQGKFEVPVEITYVDKKTGKENKLETSINYEVFNADATISATKMNVLYLGLENPIEISVPGYEPSAINASLSPSGYGTLTRVKPGQYIAKLKRRNKDGVKINVTVKTAEGKTIGKGNQMYRTMKVPSPYANINNKTGGTISAAELKVVRRVNATLSNFVFEGVKYRVTGYDYIYTPKRGNLIRASNKGASIPGQLKGAFTNAKRGDMLIISGVRASAKGVGEVNLPGALIFEIQ